MRNAALDSIKGIAVLLMVVSHVIHFSLGHLPSPNPFLVNLKLIADLLSLVLFVNVFGFLSVKTIFYRDINRKFFFKSLKRIAIFYLSFALLVFFEYFLIQPQNLPSSLNYILLTKFGSFSDFLLVFFEYAVFLFLLKIIVFRKLYSFRIHIIFWAILCSIFYLSSYFIRLNYEYLPQDWAPIIGTFSGCHNCLNFPFFIYTIPIAVGILFGLLIMKTPRRWHLLAFPGGLCALWLLFSLAFGEIRLSVIAAQRWPPSIPFLLTGSITFVLLYSFFTYLPVHKYIQNIIGWYGRHSLLITFMHIITLLFITFPLQVQISTYLLLGIVYVIALHSFLFVYTPYLVLSNFLKKQMRRIRPILYVDSATSPRT